MFDVEKIRAEFPILSRTDEKGRPLAYLDSGATAQKPQCVIDKMNYIYTQVNSNIHRGVHKLSAICTTEYEEAREEIRSFIGAGSAQEVIFTAGATASLNLVASSYGERFISKGDEIVIPEMEHHANIVPWQLLAERKGAVIKVLPFRDNGELETDKLDELLTDRTKVVAVTQASNVLGTMPDLRLIIDKAHRAGAIAVVDGCQGIVHTPVDVTAMGCDFYAFSGHKLYGPTGIGVLYGRKELLEEMPPYMGGGDMVAHVSFAKTTYAELPLKFEAGTTDYVGAIGLGEAVRFVRRNDPAGAHRHEHELLEYATEKLSRIDDLVIYGTAPGKCSIISFNLKGVHPYDLGMILDKQGVALRTGTHCAEPVMTHYGITGTARASFALYNTKEEIDRLAKATEVAAAMLK